MKSIKISIFHSHKGGKLFWNYLHKHWKKFGKIEITLSLKYLKKEITLKRLYKEHPDIIILSDCAGSMNQISNNEIKALDEYLRKERCKHVIGTYALFEHSIDDSHIDNRNLCQFFGFDSSQHYITQPFSISQEDSKKHIVYYPVNKLSPIWNNISFPYESNGYRHTQTLKNGSWFNSLNYFIPGSNPILLANNKEHNAIITYHQTTYYSSIYISSMIEYNDVKNETDCQMMYNIFVFLIKTRPLLSLQSYLIYQTKLLSQKNKSLKKSLKKKEKSFYFPSQIQFSF